MPSYEQQKKITVSLRDSLTRYILNGLPSTEDLSLLLISSAIRLLQNDSLNRLKECEGYGDRARKSLQKAQAYLDYEQARQQEVKAQAVEELPDVSAHLFGQ